jgi:hypothetical protein
MLHLCLADLEASLSKNPLGQPAIDSALPPFGPSEALGADFREHSRLPDECSVMFVAHYVKARIEEVMNR